MFKQQREDSHTRNSTALVQPKCNPTTHIMHMFKFEGARMWNKSNLSFARAGSAHKFRFSNRMNDELCERNIFNGILRILHPFKDHMRLHRIFPFHIHCIVAYNYSFVDSIIFINQHVHSSFVHCANIFTDVK